MIGLLTRAGPAIVWISRHRMSSSGSDSPSLGAIDSLGAYLTLVDQVWMQWSEKRGGVADVWFRGHASSQWPLLPGLLRAPYRQVSEHRYRHDFFLRAHPFLGEASTVPATDWDWYFLMQHYGMPTRLLDWTESALVALYFALQPVEGNAAGSVWVLYPRAINDRLAGIGNFIPIYNHRLVANYMPALWDERTDLIPHAPVAVDPPVNSKRLAAQKGKFTVHGREVRPIDSYEELAGFLRRIDVPAPVKGRLRRQLMAAGIAESALFPGLAGLGREIRDLYAHGPDR